MQFLEHLTEQDHALLARHAERRRYDPQSVILAQGEQRHAIFVLRSGEARVERRHMDFDVEVARLGAGEIFGEMSFVEDHVASASVVAERPCEVDVIDAAHVRALIERDPGFYGRFYRSIATILSRRLRETTQVGIAEYSWGGRAAAPAIGREPALARDWGGGSPLRDAATPGGASPPRPAREEDGPR